MSESAGTASFEDARRGRREWGSRTVSATTGRRAATAWLLCLLVWVFSVPAAFFAIPEIIDGERLLVLVLVFPFIGVLMLFTAIYRTLQFLKYGRPTLVLDRMPVPLGGRLVGTIRLSRACRYAGGQGILEVVCREMVLQQHGREQRLSPQIRWNVRRVVDLPDGLAVLEIPVDIAIPVDLPPSSAKVGTGTDWVILFAAATPGVDLALEFVMPVFMTEDSDSELTRSVVDAEQPRDDVGPRSFADLAQGLRAFGITAQERNGGISLWIPPLGFRRLGFCLTGLVLGTIPPAIYWISGQARPSVGVWIGMTLSSLIAVPTVVLLFTKFQRLSIVPGEIEVCRWVLFWSRRSRIRSDQVEAIKVTSSMSASGGEQGRTTTYYDLQISWIGTMSTEKVTVTMGVTEKRIMTTLENLAGALMQT